MSTNLTNLFGAYANFKKQPESLRQGQYQGLAQQTQFKESKAETLMRSLGSVSEAVRERLAVMENQRKEEGVFRIEKLIKSTDPKDKLELDTRCLLQKAGAVDLMDNIYAMELIEGDVGRMHQAEFHRQFTEKMTQNGWEKDRDLQMQKYQEEREAYYNQVKENRSFVNANAFDIGWNEDYPKNSEDVYNLYTKWYSEESKKEATGCFYQDIDKTDCYQATLDGTFDTQILPIVEKAKAAGVEEEEIAAALKRKLDKVLEYSQDQATIENLYNIPIGLWYTGEKQGLPKTFGDCLTVGAKQEIEKTRNHNAWMRDDRTRAVVNKNIQEAIKQGREPVLAYIEDLKNDPQTNYIWEEIHGKTEQYAVQADRYQEKLEKKRQKKLRMEAMNSHVAAQGKRLLSGYLESTITHSVTMPDGSALPSSLSDCKIPVMDENGKIKQIALTKDDVLSFYRMHADNLTAEQKLMFLSSPVGRSINEDIKRACRNSYEQIRLDTIEDQASANRITANLSDFTATLQANPGLFREVYGDELTDKMRTFLYLSNYQSQENTLRMIAEAKSLDVNSDENKMYLTQLNAKILEDMNLKLNALDGEEADVNLNLAIHSDIISILKARAKVYLANGMTPEEAVEEAKKAIQDDFSVIRYDGGANILLPKHLLQGTGLSGYDLSRSILNMVDNYRGDTPRRDVWVDWDFATNTLIVGTPDSKKSPLQLTRQRLLSDEIPYNLERLTEQARQKALDSRSLNAGPNGYQPIPEKKEGTDFIDWVKSKW